MKCSRFFNRWSLGGNATHLTLRKRLTSIVSYARPGVAFIIQGKSRMHYDPSIKIPAEALWAQQSPVLSRRAVL